MLQTEGDGWDQFAFPFLILFSLFLDVCLFTYTSVYVYLFFSGEAEH